MSPLKLTGVSNDDRRITEELCAMGLFDQPESSTASLWSRFWEAVGQFMTWLRWKGEYSVYGCRVGATQAYRMEMRDL